ncbi:LacI family DNA-binding transcriptional regulator [Arcanobacterium haemolyticum]|nr:LacI family DNA-binding transcriptional regulator [Arcanobacterium haemolyticum]
MEKRRRPTQEEVARLAGTSTAVVSYVLNNGPRPVSEDARRRVLAAIAETGYRPNNLARALVSGKSSVLGLVVPDLANPFLAQLAQCLEREFFGRGYSLLIGDSEDDLEREVAAVETMLRQQIDGLVWYSVDQPPPLDVIGASQVPVVVLNATPDQQARHEGGRIICVKTDERHHARMATEHLIRHGCTRIAHLGGPMGRLNARERSRGWQQALEAVGLEPAGHCSAPFTREGGFAAAATLLEFECDGVVVANEMLATGLLAGLATAGVSIPNEIKVVAMNGTSSAPYTVPSLSAVHLSIEQLAVDIAEELIRNSRGSHLDEQSESEKRGEIRQHTGEIATAANLVGRGSCGCM